MNKNSIIGLCRSPWMQHQLYAKGIRFAFRTRRNGIAKWRFSQITLRMKKEKRMMKKNERQKSRLRSNSTDAHLHTYIQKQRKYGCKTAHIEVYFSNKDI